MMCGGLAAADQADAEVQQLCDALRAELEGKAGRQFVEYVAVTVSKQVVAGTNYFVKVHIGSEEYVHMRIYRHFSGDTSLTAYQMNKTKGDAIEHFD